MMVKYIGFQAFGKEKDGTLYDCSFMVSFVPQQVHPSQTQAIVQGAIKQFKEFHPTGVIQQQMERHVMMR